MECHRVQEMICDYYGTCSCGKYLGKSFVCLEREGLDGSMVWGFVLFLDIIVLFEGSCSFPYWFCFAFFDFCFSLPLFRNRGEGGSK